MRIDEGEEKETAGYCGFDDCIIRMLDRRRFNLLHRDLAKTFVIHKLSSCLDLFSRSNYLYLLMSR